MAFLVYNLLACVTVALHAGELLDRSVLSRKKLVLRGFSAPSSSSSSSEFSPISKSGLPTGTEE